MAYWNNYSGGYPDYVSVAEKKEKAAKKLAQLKKKMPGIKPVILAGKALATTWWGKSWNQNLERYADYSNRIDRGRSYLRHGAVLDLQVAEGQVTARVQGSQSKPYEIQISIKAIDAPLWAAIKKQCDGQLKSLQDLMAGKFPKELSEIFLTKGKGLFPLPKEIAFSCSCPDWASMCKHVAAALYGIGARLDEDPTLFFTLRGVRTDDLVAEAIKDKTEELLAKATRKNAKIVDDADLSSLFGIELDTPPTFAGKSIQTTAPKNPGPKTAPPALQKTGKTTKKTATDRNQTPRPPIDQVAAIIARHKNGVDANTLAEKTGLAKTKIYGLVQRLKLQGKIKNKAHGVYVKA